MTKRRILIIDDDPELVKLTGLVLHRAGYDVQVATTAADGLAKVRALGPDLIILDIMMADMDGFQVCQKIRSDPRTASLPIIMLSALGTEDHKVTGFDAGADDYVAKPVGSKELLARTRALLKRATYARAPAGQVIAVTGAKGGVGVTTVAMNLTAALAEKGQSVILAELRSNRGSLQRSLNMDLSQDLGQLLKVKPIDLDPQIVSKAVVRHHAGFRLMVAPRHPSGDPLTAGHVDAILGCLLDQAQYLILDLPPGIDPGIRRALEHADQILLVTEPESVAVAAARSELDAMREWGVSDRVGIVMTTRSPSAILLTREAVEREVGAHVAGMVPPAPEMFQEAARTGAPAVVAKPDSLPARALKELADWLIRQLPVPA